MIGVTGATGRLGKHIQNIYPNILPIGRKIPNEKVSVIIHTAVPDVHDKNGLLLFDNYNLELLKYAKRHKSKLINVGSCWQILKGECYYTDYSQMKRRQEIIFSEYTQVIPYWIYGENKGFVYNLLTSIRNNETIYTGLQLRDFIYAKDVAEDLIDAIDLPLGNYSSCTFKPVKPYDIVKHFTSSVVYEEPKPDAKLAYLYPIINKNKTNIYEYIENQLSNSKVNL